MTDDLKAQIDACKKYNVEPLIMIKTAEEGKNLFIYLFILYIYSFYLLIGFFLNFYNL